jgi:hypothetical protein
MCGGNATAPCRTVAGGRLLQLDDLGAEAGTGLDDIDTGRERRAGTIPALSTLDAILRLTLLRVLLDSRSARAITYS